MPIEIHPPNPDWPRRFTAIKAALAPALPQALAIHHIGSTAVPGLVAKDIIDIQVTLPNFSDFDPQALERAGFPRHSPTRDHAPPGLTLAPQELAKRMHRRQGPDAANIHIRKAGRFNQRYPLLCRDYLRSHPGAAAAYGVIKQNLARLFPEDAESYYDIKDPVFDLIMSGAEDWARAVAWTPPPGD